LIELSAWYESGVPSAGETAVAATMGRIGVRSLLINVILVSHLAVMIFDDSIGVIPEDYGRLIESDETVGIGVVFG
jgi:hypothetical protein